MKNNTYKKIKNICICFLMIMQFFSLSVCGDEITNLSISPIQMVVSGFETFNIGVFCVPGQPIKSYEFSIEFNASLMQVNEVMVGNIFDGYSLFTNNGTIDNINGVISFIYGLILGSGNVSDPGFFVNISFTAQGAAGISEINILNPGITNETAYVPLSYSNGTVLIDASAPVITDQSPVIGYTGDSYVFNVSANDDTDDSCNISLNVDWTHGIESANDSMIFIGGSFFEKTITLDQFSIDNLTYSFYGFDTHGNAMTTQIKDIIIVDNDIPNITNIQSFPSIQVQHGNVNISSIITDNINIDLVYVNISYPNGSTLNSSIKPYVINNLYFYNYTYPSIGIYEYFFFVQDSSGNRKISELYTFAITDGTLPVFNNLSFLQSNPLDTIPGYGWINISCNISDDEINKVYLVRTCPDLSLINTTMTASSNNRFYVNTTFSDYGNYSYYVWANDTNNNQNSSIIIFYTMPPNWDINMDGHVTVFDLILISNHFNESGSSGWIREDVDNNGEIQVLDIVLVANEYDISWW
jgi:hypothetical protein